jgi:hypothetical protein
MKQYVDRPNGEPACQVAGPPRPGLSQQQICDCSRSAHEQYGLAGGNSNLQQFVLEDNH